MNLLGAKIYYDGGHWIAIPHTERRYKKRNGSIPLSSEEKKKVEIVEEQFNKVKGKRSTRKAKVLQECALLNFQGKPYEYTVSSLFKARLEIYRRMGKRRTRRKSAFPRTHLYSRKRNAGYAGRTRRLQHQAA